MRNNIVFVPVLMQGLASLGTDAAAPQASPHGPDEQYNEAL